jgi:hypothetical protein
MDIYWVKEFVNKHMAVYAPNGNVVEVFVEGNVNNDNVTGWCAEAFHPMLSESLLTTFIGAIQDYF